MDFKKKLKQRLYIAIGEIAVGIAMIFAAYLIDNEFVSSLGLVFTVIGAARTLQYKRITRNEQALHNREIAETDERNVKIWVQARALAFITYLLFAAIAVIVLFAMGLDLYGTIISYSMMSLVLIYWICYLIVKRKY